MKTPRKESRSFNKTWMSVRGRLRVLGNKKFPLFAYSSLAFHLFRINRITKVIEGRTRMTKTVPGRSKKQNRRKIRVVSFNQEKAMRAAT